MNEHEFRLLGLEPDNPLAILALFGMLRSLAEVRPEWSARVSWTGSPRRPTVHVRLAISKNDLVAAIGEGIAALAQAHEFGPFQDLKLTRKECRDALTAVVEEGNPRKIQLYGALMSDGAIGIKDTIVPSPLSTMVGQGHQHFLTRLAGVPKGQLPTAIAKGKNPPDLNAPKYIEEALFEEWRREDPTESFRWDPAEDRRYALRDVDPSTDSATTQHGANRLAAVGLPVFSTAPTGRPRAAALAARGFSRGRDRRIRLTWPLWLERRSLQSIVALLDLPALHQDDINFPDLATYQIETVYRSYRIANGYFANYTRAEVFVAT